MSMQSFFLHQHPDALFQMVQAFLQNAPAGGEADADIALPRPKNFSPPETRACLNSGRPSFGV